jgi:hypothetical protein
MTKTFTGEELSKLSNDRIQQLINNLEQEYSTNTSMYDSYRREMSDNDIERSEKELEDLKNQILFVKSHLK